MKQYYECHITFLPPDGRDPIGNAIATKYLVLLEGWLYSHINGDPDLGKGLKSYATCQYNTRVPLPKIKERMSAVADKLRKGGCKVLRKKIEKIIYDERL